MYGISFSDVLIPCHSNKLLRLKSELRREDENASTPLTGKKNFTNALFPQGIIDKHELCSHSAGTCSVILLAVTGMKMCYLLENGTRKMQQIIKAHQENLH